MGTDPGRGQLDRLATVTVNLAVVSLRTARDPLPLGAFCRNGQNPLTEWRRLTVLWQAHLAVDDWDRVLSSVVLSEVSAPEAANDWSSDLSADDPAAESASALATVCSGVTGGMLIWNQMLLPGP
jgi:hypothetical protein